ncbi:SCO family protein [Marinimicrobium sp. ABcell2]|uniref:SCO family protein n=1 Tax=Marinimicrobium sp. ABcell2 TaxID=3069751 RepID=UPI0027AF9D01|nr:SCO family protein [Marinimicrobium sp. ABcell2]MDQ2078482.1 SCO family protein [Marinimicrobium sp. ABcell2]
MKAASSKSPARSLLVVATLVAILTTGLIAVLVFNNHSPAPDISGNVVQPPRPLGTFSLLDHHGNTFTQDELLGRWHFVSYGFTYCPDICPMTLVTLSQLMDRLQAEGDTDDLGALFYTVDSERDTVEQLAAYVPHFHDDFVGLTTNQPENAKGFEQGLGIVAFIDEDERRENPERYNVSHGMTLYLLNPRGQLQAVFTPDINRHGIRQFSVDQLYEDYRALRAYAR